MSLIQRLLQGRPAPMLHWRICAFLHSRLHLLINTHMLLKRTYSGIVCGGRSSPSTNNHSKRQRYATARRACLTSLESSIVSTLRALLSFTCAALACLHFCCSATTAIRLTILLLRATPHITRLASGDSFAPFSTDPAFFHLRGLTPAGQHGAAQASPQNWRRRRWPACNSLCSNTCKRRWLQTQVITTSNSGY